MPYLHKVNLLADTENARRSCSSVGIPPLEIAAPVWLARDSEDTLLYVSNDFPCAASRTTDCVDVLVPASGVTMNIMMKIDRVYWHRHSLLWPERIRGLYLKAAAQVRDAFNLFPNDPSHASALSWLRWAHCSSPASLRLYFMSTPADIIT